VAASKLSQAYLHDEAAALAHVEAALWPNGPLCPHCGATDRIYALKGQSTRPGVRKCGHCRKPFTVMVGTIFERSHVPLHKWLQAICLLTSSKKGISSHQLHRILGVKYDTAWFMSHRIREAMRSETLGLLGGLGATVEADATYFGQKDDPAERRKPGQRGPAGKRPVVGLVERGGEVRTFHVDKADKETVEGIVRENVDRETALMTDESSLYPKVGAEFARHETVCHSAGEYVRDDVYTNTMDGYGSIFKRGMKGVYQHCGEQHLHRYLAEFDFRYNNREKLGVDDSERAIRVLTGAKGKRLTYRQPDQAL
jgi:transposase-like protein